MIVFLKNLIIVTLQMAAVMALCLLLILALTDPNKWIIYVIVFDIILIAAAKTHSERKC